MDHMIRDAAENHHPVYNDQAWDKMEKMLDKHLPQKKDGRRAVLFLLLFLLLGGGTVFTLYRINNNTKTNKIAPIAKNEPRLGQNESNGQDLQPTTANPPQPAGSDVPGAQASDENIPGAVNSNISNEPAVKQPAGNTAAGGGNETLSQSKRSSKPGTGKSSMNITAGGVAEEKGSDLATNKGKQQGTETKRSNPAGRKVKNSGKKNVTIKAADADNEEAVEDLVKTKQENNKKILPPAPEVKKEESKETAEAPVNKEEKKELVKAEEPATKKEPVKEEKKSSPSPDKKKSQKNIAGNFGITFSVGPDVSFVSLNKLGKATIMYGAGLSYTFAKQRLTVRTGFYASKKIYDAAPEQYHNPGGNYPYLYNVAAECKVYEIPLSVSYHFGQRNKHGWFGSAGLSSFLMKTEDYYYQYKTPSGQYYEYPWKVKNQNKHYFSVLTLSGGYTYKLSKRISLQAEPYVKIPLGGVGFGKVKLNSGGILFTATIRPFAKK